MTPPQGAAAQRISAPIPLPEAKKPAPRRRRAPARADRPFRAIALILLSTVFLSTSDMSAKYLSKTLPSIEITWIRFVVFGLIMMPAMLPGSPLYAMRTTALKFQLLRGLALLGSSVLFITALGYLPIAEASATSFVAPLFVTGLSIVFLSERVGIRRWIATAVGLTGVVVILRPGTGAFQLAALLPIASAFAWACTLVMTRVMSGRDHALTTMTYSAIVGVCVMSMLVPLVWIAPSWHDILLGLLVGVASTTGQWIVVLAFRYADASVLAPFSYIQLLWASIFGFVIFGEVPDAWTVVGGSVIVASGLYTAHRERVRRSQLLAVVGETAPNP